MLKNIQHVSAHIITHKAQITAVNNTHCMILSETSMKLLSTAEFSVTCNQS